jgi:hypothetical protein
MVLSWISTARWNGASALACTSGDHEIRFARTDRACGIADGIEAGAAQAVDGGGWNRGGQAGEQGGHASDIAIVLPRLIGAAQHDFVDPIAADRWEALAQLRDDMRREIVRPDLCQRTAIAPDRRAHTIDDECFAHAFGPFACSAANIGPPLWAGKP